MSAKYSETDERAADAIIDWWCADRRLYMLAPVELVPRIAQAIADARKAGALHQRRIDAAHAFDRCEQYQRDSGSYEAVCEIAASIAEGDANEADRHGEFEPELLARVDMIAARGSR